MKSILTALGILAIACWLLTGCFSNPASPYEPNSNIFPTRVPTPTMIPTPIHTPRPTPNRNPTPAPSLQPTAISSPAPSPVPTLAPGVKIVRLKVTSSVPGGTVVYSYDNYCSQHTIITSLPWSYSYQVNTSTNPVPVYLSAAVATSDGTYPSVNIFIYVNGVLAAQAGDSGTFESAYASTPYTVPQ